MEIKFRSDAVRRATQALGSIAMRVRTEVRELAAELLQVFNRESKLCGFLV